MTNIPQLKRAINWLISQGIITSQKDFGKKIGVENRSYLSQIINNTNPNEEIINKFMELSNLFNREFLRTGQGEMLQPITQTNFIDNNIAETNVTVQTSDISKCLDLLKKKDEQIDRLLTIIEKNTCK